MGAGDGIALEALPSAIVIVDRREARVRARNDRFARFAGRPVEVGARLGDALGGDREIDRLLSDVARAGGEATLERHRRVGVRGDTSLWLVRAAGAGEDVVLVAHEVTDEVAADEALRAACNEYFGVAAHELRGPLSAIRGWSSALASRVARGAEPDLAGAVAETLATIARQVDRMGALLADLVDVARADAGRLALDRRPTPLGDALEAAIARAPGARRAALAGPVPSCDVDVEPFALEIALARLVDRAAGRATARPEVRAERAGAFALVAVSGDAISPPCGPRDDPFTRFPRGARREPGSGLGLASAQLLFAAQGGRLWVDPVARGTRLCAALPIVPRGARRSRAPASRPAQRARVLIVDPSAARARARASLLRRAGWETACCVDAADLRLELARAPADVVLADASALDLDGLEALVARAGAPDVVLTGPARPGPSGVAERLGARAVLIEPVDPAHLITLLGAIAASRAPA